MGKYQISQSREASIKQQKLKHVKCGKSSGGKCTKLLHEKLHNVSKIWMAMR